MSCSVGTVLNQIEYESGGAGDCKIIKIAEGIVAIAYSQAGNVNNVSTYPVDEDGQWGAQIDTQQIDANSKSFVMIANYPGTDIYIVAYQDNGSSNIEISTIDIDSGGFISAVIDTHAFGCGGSLKHNNSLLHISGDVFALAFPNSTGGSNRGYLVTFDVNSDGTIDATPEIDNWTFTANASWGQALIHRDGTKYILSYDDNSNGYISTLDIANNGTITASFIDTLSGVNYISDKPSLVRITGNYYALSGSRYSSDSGYIQSFDCDTSGNLGSIITSRYFDSDAEGVSSIAHGTDCIAVSYLGSSSDGYIKTYAVDGSGNIAAFPSTTLVFESSKVYITSICEARTDVHAVAIVGDHADYDADGWVYSLGYAEAVRSGSIAAIAIGSGFF